MAITKLWLERAANSQSFSKGQDYYHEVDDLIKKGDTYTATVFGTEEYEVVITDNHSGVPLSLCSCPYDYDGICKHIVAVGLNIIDGNFEEEEKDAFEDAQSDAAALSLPTITFYEDFFLKKEASLQSAFLKQLFANDPKLRRQFYEFSKPKEVLPPEVVAHDLIEKTTNRLAKKLDKIAGLQPDDYYSRGGGRYDDYYDDEGDGYQDWINEKLDEAFSPFEKEIEQSIQNGAIETAMDYLIGLYEGCLGLEFQGDSEDYMGEDFESVALGKLDSLIDRQREGLQKAIFNQNDVKRSILFILNRWAKRKDVVASIGFFETFMIAVSNPPDMAKWLIKEIEERKMTLDLIYLTLANAETINDNTLWIDSAEKVAYENQLIMQLLLDKYLSLNCLTEFHTVANAAFTKFENGGFVPYLKIHVLKDYDTGLYIKVHLKSATTTGALEDFLTVQPLLSTSAEKDFIQTCKTSFQNLYVDILHYKGDLSDILSFVKEKSSGSYSSYSYSYNLDMPKALSFIIDAYPNEVINLVERQAAQAFNNMKMDRKGYAQACAYLKPLKNLPDSHKQHYKTMLSTLRERFKNRPAFLDELNNI